VVADRDVAQHLGAGADLHIAADGRMALASGIADAAEGDAVEQLDMVAEHRGLADHDAHAVVDEQAFADGGAGMDLDAGEQAGQLRDQPRQEEPADAVEDMRKLVQKPGPDAGIQQKHRYRIGGGGICFLGVGNLGFDVSEHVFSSCAYKWYHNSPVNQ